MFYDIIYRVILLNNFTVYIHENKINHKKYIGITSKENLNGRWHNGRGYMYNQHFWSAIQKYGWNNFEHIIYATNLSEAEASELEQKLINEYNTMDYDYGYNLAPGGFNNRALVGELNPFYGKVPEEAVKASVISRTGKKLSDEQKKKISESHKGKKHTPEHVEKYSAAQRGVPRARGSECKNSRKMLCIETGEIYDSARIAASVLGVSPSALTNSIKRNQKCCGFHWAKLENSND